MQYLAEPKKYAITEQGKKNADCADAGSGLNSSDAEAIQMVAVGKLSKKDLPITSAKLKTLKK